LARAEKLAEVLPASLAQRHDLSDSEKAAQGWRRRPLGSVMVETADLVAVDPIQSYPNVGVFSFGRGLFEKAPIDGATTSATKLNRIRADQFVYSRLFAFEGAYTAVPSRFDGYFVSGEFPTFDVDSAELLAPFLAAYLKSEQTWSELAGASKGLGVRRQRIHVDSLLKYEVWLPSLPRQVLIVGKLDRLEDAGRLRERSGARVSALQVSALNHAFAGLL
jgi:type I restriction enzyme S subunit